MENNKKTLFNADIVQFNLLEAIKYIFRNSIWILAFMLVIGISLPTIKYILDVKSSNSGSAVQNETLVNDVKRNEELLEQSLEDYELQKEYIENSVFMKLQPRNLSKAVTQYYIDVEESERFTVITAYSNYVNRGGGIIKKIHEKDNSIEEKYLQELISLSYSTSSTSDATVISLFVIGRTEEECQKYMQYAQEEMQAYCSVLNEVGMENQLSIIEDTVYVTQDTSIRERQKAEKAALNTINQDITALKTTLESLKSNNVIGQSEVRFNKIYAVIGFVIGAILGIFVLLVKFIFKSTIKYAKEIGEYTEISFLGDIDSSKKGIADKCVDKVFESPLNMSKEQKEQLVVSRILSICRDHNINKVSFVGIMSKEMDKRQNELYDKLKKQGIEVQLLGDVLNVADAIHLFRKNEYVIWNVSSQNTTYRYLNELKTFCDKKEAFVLGYIYYH